MLGVEAKKEIEEVVLRYCRGVDRADRELLESCYHPDAVEEHGSNHTGDAAGFIDWILSDNSGELFFQHTISNHLVLAESDSAAVTETYFHARLLGTDREPAQVFGRYVDRFELRDGAWRIAHRCTVQEYSTPNIGYGDLTADGVIEGYHTGTRDRSDPSYQFIAEL